MQHTTSLWIIKIFGCDLKKKKVGFSHSFSIKNLPAIAGDTGSIPGLGRSHMPLSN